MAEKRFKKLLSEGSMSSSQIWVDTETGVNYLFISQGYSGGLTTLLDRDGRPVISSPGELEGK